MRPPTSENVRWYALVAGLAVVLAILALLQYRSTRQVSDATTEHMRANLQDSLMDLRQGLEREFTPLCSAFQSDDGVPRASATLEYTNRLELWRRAAAHPGLASQVLVARSLDAEWPELLKLNDKQRRPTAMEWPKDLLPLRAWMRKATPQSLGGGLNPVLDADDSHSGAKSAKQVFPWMIDQSIPALVHPEVEIDRDAKGKTVGTLAWIVIRLDLQVLGRNVIPELVQRNFGRESESTYRITVTADADTGPIIYSSDRSSNGEFRAVGDTLSDAALNLFGRPDLSRKGHTAVEHGPSSGAREHPAAASSPIAFPEKSLGGEDDGPVRIDPIHYGDDDSDWEILAQHRQGSVEAAVAASYHRNLAINFGVLLVLGITMALIIANSRRARRLAQLQVDFVAGVSHELRTPLTGIVAAAQNIADGVVDNQARMVRYGKAILAQAQQLTDLVEQILLFSATQKDAHRFHLQLANVDGIIESSLKTTASLTRPDGFSVDCTIQPKLPQVQVDAKALAQCLQNLIANAVKYSGTSRWVGIDAVLAVDPIRGSEVAIEIEDRGLGMQREELLHIFEPFYRSPLVTAAQIHGSGLGLPLTKSMVEAMGGRLTVSSAPGKGSRFTIHLPVPSNDGQLSSAPTPDHTAIS